MRLNCRQVDRITWRSYRAGRRSGCLWDPCGDDYAPAVGALRSRWATVRAGVTENAAARRFWSSAPDNRFTTEGFEVIEGFLDRGECDRLVRLANELLPGPSRRIEGNCYTWVKSEAAHGRNRGVREVLNVNEVDSGLTDLMAGRAIQDLFAERLGEPVELLGFGIQFDDIDTTSKRGLHVDGLFPPQLKAFVYLNDVEEKGDGPYTILPGSHRWFVRKFLNDVINACTTGARRDMRYFVPSSRLHTVLAPAGTLILSTQDAMHKGWTDHWRRPRHALVAYARTARHFEGGPLTEGIQFLPAAT
jgi:hypothetical protein